MYTLFNTDENTPKTEKNYSYICYTDITLKENREEQFGLKDAIKFFTLDKKKLSLYSAKLGSHPFSRMSFACVICSEENFATKNDKDTEQIKKYWKQNIPLLHPISRYVFKLNITEAVAQSLYQEKNYTSLANHIIEMREDKMTKDTLDWSVGISRLPSNNTFAPEKNSLCLTM
ncbi:hypothetical protein [Legionella fairfieldensis]|uniref:hypothetical protein n=1 Tax=Legionella fairfieldensis TaxID=45064 RepID=UPI00048FF935|nr:hypothetical protein [Legionella fairfieldensis]